MLLREPGVAGVDGALMVVRSMRDGLAHLKTRVPAYPSGSEPHLDLSRRQQWLAWSELAGLEFRRVFADESLAAAVREAGAHARMFSLGPAAVIELFEEWTWRLDDVIGHLKRLREFAGMPGQIVVPDTSALVEGPIFDTFDWHSLDGVDRRELVRVVVPILVVEELDRLKVSARSKRVRSVLKKLWDLHGAAPAKPAPLPYAKPGPVTIEVRLDEPWHARQPVEDSEIIGRAAEIAIVTGRPVTLASGDTCQLYRAAAAGLNPALMLKPELEEQPAGQT